MSAVRTIMRVPSFANTAEGFINKISGTYATKLASGQPITTARTSGYCGQIGAYKHSSHVEDVRNSVVYPAPLHVKAAHYQTFSSGLYQKGIAAGSCLSIGASVPQHIKYFPVSISLTYNRAYSAHASSNPNPRNPENTAVNNLFDSNSGNGDTETTSWMEKLDHVRQSIIDAGTVVVNKVNELSETFSPHVKKLQEAYPSLDLENVVVPLGVTLSGTVLAWSVLPLILKRLHKYTSDGPINTLLLGNSRKNQVPYDKSVWNALEDPAKYLITFMAFTQLGAIITPSISTYLPHAWRGAAVLSFVWFLQRWKTFYFSNAMTRSVPLRIEQDKLSAFDKASSLGLAVLAIIASAETFGVPVQSILTVGGVGGVATAFAARDILGNMLTGFSLQVTKPFSVGDHIKAGSIEGQVVDVGLTSTSLINPEKYPVIVPNSLFSSQAIVNKSRAQWRSCVTRIAIKADDIDKIPSISEGIKSMLLSNPKVYLEKDVPYCYLSRLESSFGELTIGCNLKNMRKDEWFATEQEILLDAARIIKQHGVELGSTLQNG